MRMERSRIAMMGLGVLLFVFAVPSCGENLLSGSDFGVNESENFGGSSSGSSGSSSSSGGSSSGGEISPTCGNGSVEVGEQCDGSDLNNQSCGDLNFIEGAGLSCLDNCEFDFRGCEVLPADVRVMRMSSTQLTHGQSYSIFGSGFNVKSPAAPLKWETFEAGSDGVFLDEVQPEWVMYGNADLSSRYSDTWTHSGCMAVSNRTGWRVGSQSGFNTNYFDVPWTDELFVSYWYSTRLADPTDFIQFKPTRLNASYEGGNTGGGRYNETGSHSLTGLMPTNGNPDGAHFTVDNGPDRLDFGYVSIPHNQYNHIQDYRKLSAPGISNGTEEVHVVGRSHNVNPNVVNRGAGETFQLDTVLLGLMYANWGERTTTADGAEMYVDDVYIDVTKARVEIGNRKEFEDCTHREMQIPLAWSSGEITITVNQGSFENDDSLWLFVVDRNGNVSPGYPITISGPGPVCGR